MSTTTHKARNATAVAPLSIAVVASVVGLFAPFIGLPISMIAVVLTAAVDIDDRRLRLVTVGVVGLSIAANLVLVMLALPAGRDLVLGQ